MSDFNILNELILEDDKLAINEFNDTAQEEHAFGSENNKVLHYPRSSKLIIN